MLTHGNMASNINYSCRDFGFQPGVTSISFLPLSHVTARCVDLGLLSRGVTLAHLPQIDRLPQTLLELRPHILLSVPRVYEKVHTQVAVKAAKFPRKQIYQWALRTGRKHRREILEGKTPTSLAWKLADRLVYSKIRAGLGGRVSTFISGGAPLGRDLAEWYADVGLLICEGYGLTETSPVIAVNTPGAHRIGSVGKPLGNVEVCIADDGEILVRGPSVFRSYWNKPDETKLAFQNGFFRTGDIGYQDSNGYFYILDRLKDMIVTGGENVYSGEVEAVIYTHPAVREVAVFGIPDPKWGEIVKACVVLKPGKTLTAEELIAYCRRSLANFKVPRSIQFSDTELPKSGSGKILKRVLRDTAWARQERAVA